MSEDRHTASATNTGIGSLHHFSRRFPVEELQRISIPSHIASRRSAAVNLTHSQPHHADIPPRTLSILSLPYPHIEHHPFPPANSERQADRHARQSTFPSRLPEPWQPPNPRAPPSNFGEYIKTYRHRRWGLHRPASSRKCPLTLRRRVSNKLWIAGGSPAAVPIILSLKTVVTLDEEAHRCTLPDF